jgi:trimeric autotransporter adhesin
VAVYQFSTLADGQSVAFNPSVDRLNFDQTSIAAGDLFLVMEGSSLRVSVKSGPQAGKDVLLTGTALEQIAGGINFTFADGSVVRIGDNSVGTANDAAGNGLTGGAGRDLLMGLGGNDNLQAGDNNDSVVGGTGNDFVSGNNGNDWVEGGAGIDTLNGGGGQDTYVFREFGAANADLLADFSTGWDRIELDAAAFTQIGAAGRFSAGDARFFAGAAAHDADDRIIFNSATGQIFYDADGNGAGAAQLIGTLGAGRTVVAADFNVIGEAGGGGNVINGTAGNDTLIGTPDDDTINGLGGNDSLFGNEGADSLDGGDGNDTLDAWTFGSGDLATDTLNGGLGNDVYQVHDDGDLILADPGGIDTVRALNASWTLAGGLENLDLEDSRGISADGTGNALDNVIRGASEGGTLAGLGGNDTLIARNVQNSMTLLGGDGNDTLLGDGSNFSGDNFDGGAGNDVLDGGAGPDILTGGTGADHFVIHETNAQDAIDSIQDFSSGVDKIRLDATNMPALGASGNFSVNDPRFFAGGAAHDADDRVIWDGTTLWFDPDGTGSISQERLAFVFNPGGATVVAIDIEVVNGSGGNTINGTAGNDTLAGTDGNDTINGLGGNDSIDGGLGSDSLIGGDGNDTLVGIEPGGLADQLNDTLDGGLGNDLYLVRESDVILADPGGIDTVEAFNTDWTLGTGLDNLDLTDSGLALSGTGNELNNVIRSASEGGTLQGLGGNDLLIARHVQNTANLLGGDGNDTLDGSGGSTNMDGGSGNDVLIGGGGSGSGMTGGTGADTFAFNFIGSVATIFDFASGTDKVRLDGTGFTQIGASGNFTANDPRFWASDAAHDADDRIIYNELTGGLWYDPDGTGAAEMQLIASLDAGARTLVATDITVINGTAPTGQVINGTSSNDSLVGGTGNDTINGNQGNDTLRGNAGDDSLDGGSGTDLLDGGTGNDIYVVSTGDTLVDAGGIDLIFSPVSWSLGGSFENLEFTGTASVGGSGNFLSNRIVGNSGANFIRARDGNDTITGGGGADSFEFVTAPSASNADLITDFVSGVDKLRLDDGVHAGIGATGNFVAGDTRFAAGAGFTSGQDASDRVIYDTSTGNLYYDSNGSAAGGVQLIATLEGAPGVVATDIGVI